jgi:hypothetical protein
MPTDPLTGSRYPASTAVPNVNQDIQNAVTDLADNTIPNFSTTTTRDNAYTAWVALGNSMRDGLKCVVNGVPYRRINGTWRIDRTRGFSRAATGLGTGFLVTSGGSAGRWAAARTRTRTNSATTSASTLMPQSPNCTRTS